MSIYDNDGLPVLFVDEAVIVVDKPAGLPSVPGRPLELHDCAHRRVLQQWPDALVVHRLDMATSGVLVFARSKQVQGQLNRAFAERRVHKRYVALVHGAVEPETGHIDLPLRADWPNRPRQMVDIEGGRPSLTHWRRLGACPQPGCTRLELSPITGRSHQLRVHLQALGHPIVGDRLYGPGDDATRLMLHATLVRMDHPMSGAPLEVMAEAPF